MINNNNFINNIKAKRVKFVSFIKYNKEFIMFKE